MKSSIIRNLEDGADYRPDWRHACVLEYLKRHSEAEHPPSCDQLLRYEPDVIIRLAVRYQLDEKCGCPGAVGYALGTQQSNARNGIASMIRAMVIAERTPTEIAEHLKTKSINITFFTKLYFDVARYIDSDVWLKSVVQQDFCLSKGPELARERRLMRIAFDKSWRGLSAELSPQKQRSQTDVKAALIQLQHAVCTRALEYVEDLRHQGIPADQEDYQRFMMVNNAKASETEQSTKGHNGLSLSEWMIEAAERNLFEEEFNKQIIHFSQHQDEDGQSTTGRRRRLAA